MSHPVKDTPEFREFFLREYPRLVRALGVAFDADSAADAVHEAFIEADRRWARIVAYEDPAGWVRRVAVNRLLTGRRNRRRRQEILATAAPLAHPADAAPDDLVDLRRAVDELPNRMRLCVCLHYLLDLSVDEVAETLSISPGTVKSNLHDGRRRLRELMEVEP